MFPLTIDIYARIVNYFFHLLELAGEGNTVMQSGVAECITLVNNNQTCCLTSVLYLFKIIRINLKLETGQHVWEERYYYSCQKYIKEKV